AAEKLFKLRQAGRLVDRLLVRRGGDLREKFSMRIVREAQKCLGELFAQSRGSGKQIELLFFNLLRWYSYQSALPPKETPGDDSIHWLQEHQVASVEGQGHRVTSQAEIADTIDVLQIESDPLQRL